MCGNKGKGNNSLANQQALANRIRRADDDMLSRVNRGLKIRRLLTPLEVAKSTGVTGLNLGSLASKFAISDTPVFAPTEDN